MVMLVEEGPEKGVLDSLLEVEAQAALLPLEANASVARRTGEEMVRDETPPCEAVAITQEKVLAADSEEATAATAGMVLQEVPTTLALVGAAQAGGDLPHGEVPVMRWTRRIPS
jgi:hypothetical protein